MENLPLGVFSPRGKEPRCGIAYEDFIFDLREARLYEEPDLNLLMAQGRTQAAAIRARAVEEIRRGRHLVLQTECELLPPVRIGDYTDFYASIFHATRVGRLFRPDNPLLPNYKFVPVAYHGRSSSIVLSGVGVRRPSGQLPGEGGPVFGPTRELDFELELGIFVGVGNRLGEPVPLERAWDLIFGFCIVNDWSARDIQRWEYQPLGPFLGKNFATTISPWVVLSDALEPYRTAAYRRPDGDPRPLAYLWNEGDQQRGGLDITMEAWLTTKEMRHRELAPQLLCRTSTRWLYWTPAQMVAHHTSNGCNLRPGDLLATGTVSGPEERERACLLEITNNGREPIQMPTGEQRCYLEDGDEVILRAFCRQEGLPVINFGEARAIIEG